MYFNKKDSSSVHACTAVMVKWILHSSVYSIHNMSEVKWKGKQIKVFMELPFYSMITPCWYDVWNVWYKKVCTIMQCTMVEGRVALPFALLIVVDWYIPQWWLEVVLCSLQCHANICTTKLGCLMLSIRYLKLCSFTIILQMTLWSIGWFHCTFDD